MAEPVGRKHLARGLCSTHYNQRHAPSTGRHRKMTVACTWCGYPFVNLGARQAQVHRLALEAKLGASLGSQAAHHICANSMCVNPDHLQPVTAAANTAEMLARTYMVRRIRDLEAALRRLAPGHSLLQEVGIDEMPEVA